MQERMDSDISLKNKMDKKAEERIRGKERERIYWMEL